MKKFTVLFVAVLSLAISSCGGGKKNNEKDLVEGKGGITLGGVFKVNEIETFRSLFPLSVTDVYSYRIANQVYQSLFKFNQATLAVENNLADSYKIDDNKLVYTIKIKKGINFQDNDCFSGGTGRELKATDVKYCFDKICEAIPQNKMYWLFKDKVVGAQEYFASTKKGTPLAEGVKGVEVVDDYTIRITLVEPFGAFDQILAHMGTAIYPKEAFDKFGKDMRVNAVGTGPFTLKKVKENVEVILARNEKYWETDEHGNQLPYLKGIKVTFISEKSTELKEFQKGNLDMIWEIPVDEIPNVIGSLEDAQDGKNAEFQLQSSNSLSVQYYAFLYTHEVFNNINVRKAFNMAIDREELVNITLQGEGEPAFHGFVPPMDGYPQENVKGYNINVDEARKLLAKAGYPNGKGFPNIELNLNSGGKTQELMAEAIQNELKKNLNVDIDIKVLPMNQHQNELESGRAAFWRIAWVADYPDPENFLNLFYSKNLPEDASENAYINSVRYTNPKFDEIFVAAKRESDPIKRMELFAQADQILMDDAVVMPLYYDDYLRLLNPQVRNLPMNSMEYRDFTRVYFAKKKKKKK
jgi:peptide/nickel transport system substrate-binding protein